MTRKRRLTDAQRRAMHAGGAHAPTRPVAQEIPPGRVAALASPPPKPEKPPAAPQPIEPIDMHSASGQDVDAVREALVFLALSTGGDDAAVLHAAQEISKRRAIPLEYAMRIVAAARLNMTAVGRKRKEMDPETQARLIGETRTRFSIVFQTAMSKENFGKGGAAAAVKAAEKIALIDGCPVDGMVQIVGHVTHDHEHRVIDPERAVIAEGLLEMFRRRRVIEVEAEEASVPGA